MSQTLALILAGGKGRRMDILCHVRPKPALSFAGRFRVIDFSLSNCIYSGINDIAVLTDYQRSHMGDYLKQWHTVNAISTNLAVLEPRVGSYQGTANAVYQNLDHLSEHRGDTALILAGDHVYKLDYRQMLAFHRKAQADVTVGILPVPFEEAHRFGTVTLGADGRILEFLEKSPTPQSNLASMGIYAFDKDFLAERLAEDAADLSSQHDFGYSLLPKMVKRDRMFAYRFEGYWQDIGTVESYYQANMELTKQEPAFSLDGSSPVLTERPFTGPPRLTNEGNIRNSLISPGCVIEGRVENSVLSPGVRVEEEAVVKDSVVMGDTSIGYHSIVDGCVLDEGVHIGEFCYLGFGSRLVPGDSGVTIVGKEAAVPPHTAIGRNCKILPHVGASDFGSGVIPAGTVICRGVVACGI